MRVDNMGRLALKDSAFIIIDMQVDFVERDGALFTPGAAELIAPIKAVKSWLKERQVPVFYSQEIHRPQKIDFGMEMVNGDPVHCIEGTRGAGIVPQLAPEEDDIVVTKRRYSAFNMTDLDMLMRALNKTVLIIAGVTTDVCVYATALDANQREIHPIVLSDCVAGTSVPQNEAFLKSIGDILGETIDSRSLMERLA